MQFKTTNSNLLNTQDKKISNKFYQHNACRDLEKEIHSLCWYNGINQIFTSTGRVMSPLPQEISSLTVVFMKSFLSVKS